MINENVKNWLMERGFAERLTEHSLMNLESFKIRQVPH